MRLFVGIDIPDRLADAVADAQDRLADAEGLRPVDPANAHLTLFFLGAVAPERVDEVGSALERAVDDRAFTPHTTLARMDDARGTDLIQRVVRETDPNLGAFRVEEIQLKETTLTNDGPEHETVRAVEL